MGRKKFNPKGKANVFKMIGELRFNDQELLALVYGILITLPKDNPKVVNDFLEELQELLERRFTYLLNG